VLRRPPDWTDFNENDPGAALLELLSYVAAELNAADARRRRRRLFLAATGASVAVYVLRRWSDDDEA
jgi:hypothetical protein